MLNLPQKYSKKKLKKKNRSTSEWKGTSYLYILNWRKLFSEQRSPLLQSQKDFADMEIWELLVRNFPGNFLSETHGEVKYVPKTSCPALQPSHKSVLSPQLRVGALFLLNHATSWNTASISVLTTAQSGISQKPSGTLQLEVKARNIRALLKRVQQRALEKK